MLADLDETIRQLLIRYVPLNPSEVDISFEAPDREWSGRVTRPTVNCFLWDVRENHVYRETDWDVRINNGTAIKRKAPIRIDATYQICVWARAPEDEHRLLWRLLATLFRHPTLPEDLVQGALREQVFPVLARVGQPEQAPKNAVDLWQAVDNRIRPSLTYVVTLALDPEKIVISPLTFTRVARLRDAAGEAVAEALQILGRVRVREDRTRCIAGATVLLHETGAEVTTDAEGRFTFLRAPRGRITLVVRAPGRPEVTHPAEVPSPSYDVEL